MIKPQFPDEQSDAGEFIRQEDAFRGWIRADGSSEFPAVANRYHLYVSLACPWAHRTIIVRALKQLQDVIPMTIVDPIRDVMFVAFDNESVYVSLQFVWKLSSIDMLIMPNRRIAVP